MGSLERAWQKYDDKLSTLPSFKENHLVDTAVTTKKEKKFWLRYFESIYNGERNSCDIK